MNNLKSRKGGASLRNLKRLLCLLLVLTMLPINAFASDIIVPGSGGTSPGSGGGGSGTKWSSPTNLGPGMLLHVQSSERTVTFDYTDPANVVSKGYDEVSRLFKFLHIEHTTIIPKRLSDGYGVSECHVAGIQDSLIVTVDNGIAAGEILDKAAGRNNLIVVIDHHLPGEGVPASADIIIDTHMFPSACGFNDYCGAGLAYKLACHMLQGVNVPARLSNDLLVLAGIGTIADSMPLIQDNRSLVMRALDVINTHFDLVSPGLSNLLAECGTPGAITAHTLSYKLVPLINAPGRMYDAGGSSSLKVLVCEDHELGAAYVTKMVAINQRRRQVVSGYIEQACKEAQNQSSPTMLQHEATRFKTEREAMAAGRKLLGGRPFSAVHV